MTQTGENLNAVDLNEYIDETELDELSKIVDELDALMQDNRLAVEEVVAEPTLTTTAMTPIGLEEVASAQLMSENVDYEFMSDSVFLQAVDPMMFQIQLSG